MYERRIFIANPFSGLVEIWDVRTGINGKGLYIDNRDNQIWFNEEEFQVSSKKEFNKVICSRLNFVYAGATWHKAFFTYRGAVGFALRYKCKKYKKLDDFKIHIEL